MPRGPSASSTARIDQIVRGRPAGNDDDQRVDVARHGDEVGVVAIARRRPAVAAEIADGQPERLEPAGDGLADAAEADDADRAVAQGGGVRR